MLRKGQEKEVWLVYLRGSYELILERMKSRKDHFMKDNMLKSQFDALEEPTAEEGHFIAVDISRSIPEVVADILENVKRKE